MQELLKRLEEQVQQLRSAIEKYEKDSRRFRPQLDNAIQSLCSIGSLQRAMLRKVETKIKMTEGS
jgi:sugar-specific transcriptional regulator TrmB